MLTNFFARKLRRDDQPQTSRQRRRIRPGGRRGGSQRDPSRQSAELWLAPASQVLEDRTMLSTVTLFDTSLSDYQDNPFVSNVRSGLDNGLDEIASRLGSAASSGDFTLRIPGVLDRTQMGDPAPLLSSLLNDIPLETLFTNEIADEIDSELAGNPTLTDFVSFLNTGLDDIVMVDSQEFVISVGSASGSFSGDIDPGPADSRELRFSFVMSVTETTPDVFSFDLGRNADPLGLVTDRNVMQGVTVDVESTFEIELTFGTVVTLATGDFDGEMDADDLEVSTTNADFFVRNTSLTGIAEIDQTGPNKLSDFNLQIGFLGIKVDDGEFELTGGVELALDDPDNADGLNQIQLDEIAGAGITASTSGSLTATLPIDVLNVSGFASFRTDVLAGLSPTLTLSGTPFDPAINGLDPDNPGDPRTAPIATPSDFDEIANFTNLSAGAASSLVDQLGGWWDTLRNSVRPNDAFSFFDESIPFARNTTLGDLLDIGGAFDRILIFDEAAMANRLVDMDGVPTFDTIQQFAAKLDEFLDLEIGDILPSYDAATDEASFHIALMEDFTYDADPVTPGVQNATIDFDLDLGPLSVEAATEVEITGDAEVELDFGYILTPLGLGFTLGMGTTLASLNDGVGVEIEPGVADILVKRSDGTTFEVDFTGDSTIADVISSIATASGGNVTAVINNEMNGLDLIDGTFDGGVAEFSVEQINGSNAGFGLGIVGEDVVVEDNDEPTPNDGIINGTPLHGDSLGAHFFVENASLSANAELTASPIDAEARFGFVGLGTTGGSASVMGSLSLDLKSASTGTVGGRSNLVELYEAFVNDVDGIPNSLDDVISEPVISGSGTVLLDNIALDPSGFSGLALGVDPKIEIIISDFEDLEFGNTLTVDFSDAGSVIDFEQVEFDDVLAALRGVVDFVTDVGALPALASDLPILNLSFTDLLGFVEEFERIVDDFEENPTLIVQEVEGRIKEALGLPGSSPAIDIELNGTELLFNFVLETGFVGALPVNFDLGDAGILAGAANLAAEGSATVEVGLGIDLNNPVDPFLVDDRTMITLALQAVGDNLNFNAAIGPFGLFVTGGFAALNKNGDPDTDDPVELVVTVNDDDSNNKHLLLSESIIDDVSVNLIGEASAQLPLFFPTSTSYVGNLDLEVGDLNDIPGTTMITSPDFGALLSDFELEDAIPLFIDGFDLFLGGLQDLLDGDVFGVQLPLVGENLKDAAQFIDELREELIDPIRDAVENAPDVVFDLITNVLEGVFDDVVVNEVFGSPLQEITWDVMRTGQVIDESFPIDFGLGIPALGLDIDGDIRVQLDWTLNFGVGVSLADGFFVDVSNDPELNVMLNVTAPGLSAEGNLFFLQLLAEDDGSSFTGQFNVNITDGPGGDGMLTFGEIGLIGIEPSFNAAANIDLDLTAGFGTGVLPQVLADFELDWEFSDLSGDAPHIAFNNISMDLGTLVTDIIKPIADSVSFLVEPIQPFLDVVSAPLPIVSDLAGEDISLLDIAGLFGYVDAELLDGLIQLADLIVTIGNLPPEDNIVINFGSFVLTNPIDIRDFDDLSGIDAGGLVNQLGYGDGTAAFNNVTDGATKNFLSDIIGGTFGGFDFPILTDPLNIVNLLLGRDATFITYDLPALEFGFEYSQFFPIVGPLGGSITGSITATVDLAFGFDSSGLRQFFDGGLRNPALIFNGFYISANPQNGNGAAPLGEGPDLPEFTLTGKLLGAAELNVGVASAGVGGGVELTVGLNVNDPNGDGRTHLNELLGNIFLGFEEGTGPLNIFDVTIEAKAVLEWFIEILFVINKSGTIGEGTIFEAELTSRNPVLGGNLDTAGDPVDGVLQLNIGKFAADRLHGNATDIDETLTVEQTGNGQVKVSGFGVSQTYDGVTRIIGDAGRGNDHLTFFTTAGSPIPVELEGGFGDDVLDLAGWAGPATVLGDSGNDTIKGGSANDALAGGKGDDLILGNGGNDTIDGGTENDELHGNDGNDTVTGGSGNDRIFGEGNNDELHGNAGDDYMEGGMGGDTMHGGAGRDSMIGGAGVDQADGSDLMFGNEDNDIMLGDNGIIGSVTLISGSGNDTMSGGTGDDFMFGQGGQDEMRGNAGHDFMRGGTENDELHGNLGNDVMFGDSEDDEMFGNSGDDLIYGGAHNDRIDGGTGHDILFGDDGLVAFVDFGLTVTPFPGLAAVPGGGDAGIDDKIIGDGNPALIGGFGGDGIAQTLDLIVTEVNGATDGVDIINGGAGEDTALGGAGRDTMPGGRQGDEIFGDFDPANPPMDDGQSFAIAENDVLIGDGGRIELDQRRLDHVQTVPGNDTTEVGDDTILGNGKDDYIFGGGGSDTLYGRTPADTGPSDPEGITDRDIIIGDDGEIIFETIPGDPRPVTVPMEANTNFSNDTVVNTGGNDTLFGNRDNDTMFGGVGNDTLHGNAGDDVALGDNGQILFEVGLIDFIQTLDTVADTGGTDSIFGNAESDTLLGGVAGDTIRGNAGDDIALGDNGLLDFLVDAVQASSTLTLVATKDFNMGGATDSITGNEGSDTLMGGDAGDQIFGDSNLDPDSILGTDGGTDVAIGDQGRVLYASTVIDEQTVNFITLIETTDTVEADGGVDTIFGNDFNDTILGGVAGDILHGESQLPVADSLKDMTGDDVLIGDEGRLRYDIDADPATLDLIQTFKTGELGGNDRIFGNDGSDTAMGGSADDLIYGDFYTSNGDEMDAADITFAQANDPGTDVLIGDGGEVTYDNADVTRIRTIEPDKGGEDTIAGNDFQDTILGGFDDDRLLGEAETDDLDLVPNRAGNDIVLGDNGELNYVLPSDTIDGRPDVEQHLNGTTVELDGDTPNPATLDVITTTDPTHGGNDTIFGNAGADTLFGGTLEDAIWGDTDDAANGSGPDGADGSDLIAGDHMKLYPSLAAADAYFTNNDFFAIDTREEDGADNGNGGLNDFDDTLFGNAANDTMLGQQGDDVMFGGTGNDDMVGGQNIQSFSPTAKDDLDPMSPADVAAINAANLADQNPLDNRINDLNDVIDGGAGFDLIAGDNATVINGAGPFEGAFSTNQRFRNVGPDGLAYHMVTVSLQNGLASVDIGFQANVTAANNADPAGFGERVVVLWDHSRDAEIEAAASPNAPRPFGNDVIAGGSEDDVIFGQLGDDIVQGDGAIETVADADNPPESFQIPDTDLFGAALHYNVTEQTSDGNDYAEGNGGNDILLGNLGQDDLLGGSSDLFGLVNGVFGQNHPVDRIARPDGGDQIFGGAGNPVRLARNDYVGASDTHSTGPVDDDPLIPLADRHARDADFIFGDNARAFRLVDNGAYVGYNYDLSGQLIARTATPIDYAYTMQDVLPEAIPGFSGIGIGDLIMGESGDDTIHGMTGDDALFGNSDDDDIYGEIGNDWISGGTGQDGILGDDGLLLTSRNIEKANNNDDDPAEPLYGVAKLDEVDEVIETPGNIHLALIHVDGALKKTADLITFDLRTDITGLAANDILFGGLDDDFVHAGAGSDALSGAEALPEFYAGGTAVNEFLQAAQQIEPIQAPEVDPPAPPPLTPEPFWFDVAPYNPGDTLRFEGNGKPAEFFLYNEFEPRRKILLSDLGEVIEFSTDGVFSLATTLEAVFGGSLTIPTAVNLQVVVQLNKPKNAAITDVTVAAGAFFDQPALLAHIQSAMDAALGAGVVEATVNDDGDLTLLLVGAHGQQQVFLRKVVAPADVHEFLLNFDETEGIVDTRFVDAIEGPGAKQSDGDDALFGDLGNDWIVGGTGRDRAYGGRDEDLINADDDHNSTLATAGQPGLKQNDAPVDALDNNIPDPFQAYSDYAYGGAGRDVLVLNTGADRMVDWVGEFNSYIAPFAPFGAFHISRSLSPHLREFLYDLSEADGADQTVPDTARFVAHKSADVRIDDPDPARNGEPYGELGLILQQDEGWKDQTGGPADPQAGNIPGGPREIMRRELFSGGGAPLAFASAAGDWNVESGKFKADPMAVGAEAVSLYHLNAWQPNYFEILVSATAEKDKAGVNSNAYVIFDYQDEFNFKFAGFDAGLDKLRIGRRTTDGWIVDVQSNMQLKANTEYDIFVSINGSTVTMLVGASQISHDFGVPLNEGFVGLATDNSVTHFDDWQVQKLPPEWAASIEDDFNDGVADPFLVRSGDWQVNAGRFEGSATTDAAVATVPILVDHLARVEIHATLAGDDFSGVVFDYYGPEEFKFAALSAASDEVLIGHRTTRGWFVDNAVAQTVNAGDDYRVTVSLAGSTVSVLVDDQAVLGHVFNAILNDGQMGLIARGGTSSFDDVLIRSNDADMAVNPGGGNALLFDGQPGTGDGAVGLTHGNVQPALSQAFAYWAAAGTDGRLLDRFKQVDVRIVNLPGSTLGYQTGTGTIWLDQNAAGLGWWDGLGGSVGSGIDLISVVTHEAGHVLGLPDLYDPATRDNVMHGVLGLSERRVPSLEQSTPDSTTTTGEPLSNNATAAESLDFDRRSFSLFDDLSHDVIPSLIPATLDFQSAGLPAAKWRGRLAKRDDQWSSKSFDDDSPYDASLDALFADFEDHLADEVIGASLASPVN